MVNIYLIFGNNIPDVAQLRIVVGILVLLVIRMYYIGYQIDRIGLPKR